MSQCARSTWSVAFLLGLAFAQLPQFVFAVDPAVRQETISEASQYVRQALEFRIEGDTQYSQMLLRLALRISPDYAPAHWAKGELLVDGKWTTVSDAQAILKDDVVLKEYLELREQLADSPDADLRLARWCRKQGWDDNARVHLVRQLRNPASSDKSRVESMRKLGYQEFEGALMSRQEIRQLQQLRNRDRKSQQKWLTVVERWAVQSESERPAVRESALEQLQEVTDPAAIPALESILVMNEGPLASEAVQAIGRIDTPESTRSLVRVALHSRDAVAVQVATDVLRGRPLHDYTPLLLVSLSAKLESRFKVVTGDSGVVYHEHVVRQEGAEGDRVAVRRNLAVPEPTLVYLQENTGGRGAPASGRNRRSVRQESFAIQNQFALGNQLQRQLELTRLTLDAMQIENQVAASNRSLEQSNAKVFALLETLTEAGVPSDAAAWWDWWQGYNEVYAYDQPTETACFDTSHGYGFQIPVMCRPTTPGRLVPIDSPSSGPAPQRNRLAARSIQRNRLAAGSIQRNRLAIRSLSCFAAGTSVWTARGTQAIESLQPGDRVLSQDVDTGELGFRVVANTTVRPAAPLLQIQVADSQVLTTEGHPFWVEGNGWRMAKLLKEGDLVFTAHGSARIDSIQESAPQEAYNLVVDGTHNYFVGDSGILVHDNNYRSPTRAVTPGLSRQPVQLAAH